MTHHRIKITDHWGHKLHSGIKTFELRVDNRDYQTGDTIEFLNQDGQPTYLRDRTITHVLKNITGLTPGWAILSLSTPALDDALRQKEMYYRWYQDGQDTIRKQNRSIAALRGQITKQRNTIAALRDAERGA